MTRYWCAFVSATIALLTVLALGAGASAQTETILHTFSVPSGGDNPLGSLIADGQGNLYGTTQYGGSGYGVVFELTPNTTGTWSEQVLYKFAGPPNDGSYPSSALIFDGQGNLYGTTQVGGPYGAGTVFELSPGPGGVWSEKVLYGFKPQSFGGTDGFNLYADGLAFDGAGNLFGITTSGGAACYCGTVFELSPGSNGTWTEKVIHRFTGGTDGGSPAGSTLVLDAAGNLYGVTNSGGTHDYGVVYELVRGTAGSWTEKVLYAFPGGNAGAFPFGKLLFDSAGNLYGTTYYTAYELSPTSAGSWTIKTLHNFGGGTDGANVQSGMVFDKAGNLYGTTYRGGKHYGTVFELTPQANGAWSERVLHRFSPTGGDGLNPQLVELIVGASGKLYGTTANGAGNSGTVFEIAP
jgi:uncharacterized repeat protein (TIGR03803 family)